DGKIAYTVESADGRKRDVWVMNSDGSGKRQLTDAPNFSENPNWSPDGNWIVFDSDRTERGNLDVYKMRPDGSEVTQLTDTDALDALPAFSPDGTKIVFVSDRAHKDVRRLYLMSADGGRATRLLQTDDRALFEMVPDWQPLSQPDRCTIRGTIAGELLVGTKKNDVICGGGGDDEIRGG